MHEKFVKYETRMIGYIRANLLKNIEKIFTLKLEILIYKGHVCQKCTRRNFTYKILYITLRRLKKYGTKMPKIYTKKILHLNFTYKM